MKTRFRMILALLVALCAVLVIPSIASAAIRQGEDMTPVPTSTGVVYTDANAINGQAFLMYHNGAITSTMNSSIALTSFKLRARGKQCVNGSDDGWPTVNLTIDGTTVATGIKLNSVPYANFTGPVSLTSGSHSVSITFTNDYSNATCDRNAVIDQLTLLGSSSSFLFEDDFNGTAGSHADTSKWVDYGGGCGAYAGWGDIACGQNETLDGSGHLVIHGTPSAGDALQTLGKFSCLYCRYNVWAKVPSQAGYWSGIWTLNGSQTGSETLTGETDISEVYTQFQGSNVQLHSWNAGTDVSDFDHHTDGSNLSAAFHKYSVRFGPSVVTFYLDDVVVQTVHDGDTAWPWYWGPDVTRGHFLILDLAVGGAGQNPPTSNGDFLVDRVEAES